MPPAQDHLTYEQVADMVERELGERPALSSLRSARSAATRSGRTYSRITAGMPTPIGVEPELAQGGRSPVIFSRQEIETWLANHPRRHRGEWQRKITAATEGKERDQTVLEARSQGLSWQAIADAIGQALGTEYTKQAAQQRYGPRT